MSTSVKTYIIDAFTQDAFKGNPAGVCLLENLLPSETMQHIAAELNLSETAFLISDPSKTGGFLVRYFTPTVEIDFCGHATLASAKLVLTKSPANEVWFTTGHGLVLHAKTDGASITLLFPLYAPVKHPNLPGIQEALGLSFPPELYWSSELEILLLEVPDADTLCQLTPDFSALMQAVSTVKGLAVTCVSPEPGYDFYSRCFWPWVGIDEDPVTGSAHSVLAHYWKYKLKKTKLKAFQASARGGSMDLQILPDSVLKVTAQARIVLEGLLFLDE